MYFSTLYIANNMDLDQTAPSANNDVHLLFMNICFYLCKQLDPDEMQHHAAFHLGLHCLTSIFRYPESVLACILYHKGSSYCCKL